MDYISLSYQVLNLDFVYANVKEFKIYRHPQVGRFLLKNQKEQKVEILFTVASSIEGLSSDSQLNNFSTT